MSGGRRFRPTGRVAAREVDGDLVLLDLEDGEFFHARGVGARVWDLLIGGMSLDEVTDIVASRFDLDQQQVRGDVERFVGSLVEKGLLIEGEA